MNLIKQPILRLLAIITILLFYFWVATAGYFTFSRINVSYADNHGYVYYNLLKDSFLSGKLYLPVEPRAELFTLKDPYEPRQNQPYKLQDASLYKGKYYLYFGPAPVFVLYLPYYLITGKEMSDSLAVFIFSCGGFLFAVALLLYLRKKYFSEIPEWMVLICIFVLGFAGLEGILLRRPKIYEVATSCGLFFLTGAVYFFCKAFENNIIKPRMLLFGSLFLGLAATGRLQITFLSLLLFYYIIKKIKSMFENERRKLYINLLLPFSICILLLGFYNYCRFDDPLESGLRYQLTIINLNSWKMIYFENIPFNAYLDLFRSPVLDLKFPYVHLNSIYAPPNIPRAKVLDAYYVAGIIPCFPFVLLLIVFLFYKLIKSKSINFEISDFPWLEFWIILLPVLFNLFLQFVYIAMWMRYKADIMTLLILASSLCWFYLDLKLGLSPIKRILFRIVVVVVSLMSIFSGFAFSIEMSEASLQNQNPVQFGKLESWFSWFEPIISFVFFIVRYIYSNLDDILSRL